MLTLRAASSTPELLAPAGTIEAGLTAFDSGADAVYAGLSRFNARERGKNFTLEELSKLIAYAHQRNRRVYVTLNTLLKESEIKPVTDLLVELALLRPDAIIVQDLGLVRILREHFAELEIHASTQMALHNSAGLEIAARLGIRRVILERQVTFREIEAMRPRAEQLRVELEVFVHGALCCSRSGICLFSSWMGGWSGNRGKCKQPCRRRYYSGEGNGFFFSPSDLYALEDLEQLREMGIAGLKIEGRLRKPDYIKKVVSAYRMSLDAAPGKEGNPARSEAKSILSGALGRRWHRPFHSAKDFRDTVRHETLGAAGLLCGKVTRNTSVGFEVELTRPLRRYDTIRVQPKSGDEGPSLTIKTLKIGRRQVKSAGKGQTCWISSDQKVERGSLVYKTGSATSDLAERVSSLPLARTVIDLRIQVSKGALQVETRPLLRSWRLEVNLEPALKKPLTSESLVEQFRKSRSQRLVAGHIEVELEEGLFIPPTELKNLRRDVWQWIEEQVDEEELRKVWSGRCDAVLRTRTETPFPRNQARETVVLVGEKGKNSHRGSRTARRLLDLRPDGRGVGPNDEVVLPDFCAEKDVDDLRRRIETLIRAGRRRFRITALFGFALLPTLENLYLTASFPLPVCNSVALAELMDLGVTKATAWVELEREAIEMLRKRCGGAIEMMTYGRLPLLSTRLTIPVAGRVTDGRGAGFQVVRELGLTNIYPDQVFSIPLIKGVSQFIDLSHAKPNESRTQDFNLNRELL